MNELTCIIIGGGHTGLAALKAIKSTTQSMMNGRKIRFILLDRQPGHVRKVMMFRPAVSEEEIMVPWTHYFSEGVDFVQGTVTSVDYEKKRIRYTDVQGNGILVPYHLLIVAVGSIVRRPNSSQGGIALTDPQAAANIREYWRQNLWKAVDETVPEKRKRLMTIAVAGAGISGIETSAELALAMRKEASALRLNPSDIAVYLLNAKEYLFPEGPYKVGRKLNLMLSECGVTVLHNCKAIREEAGVVRLSNGDSLEVGQCIWTIGLMPNPILRSMGLPLSPDGQVLVDESYRVQGVPDVYSIGDCAKIVDPSTSKSDQMTCKEGGMQARRLGDIVLADLEGRPAPIHKSMMDVYGIGLGKDRGLVWARKWGLDIIITGKLAWKLKKVSWDSASFL
ncbi:NAD(P)/FAD-dependent oxidoreductase [Gracilibacillus dipsosauri]|uniref:Pyridine nucleotide-disulfide oxidoreductase n=1 Tax=Gracilibacillus dipsosauri TaxID=178340 RepID=A0A317L3M2_9BACI|nr:FAD-dependent oxidoreductase [Gracilibacillus dipsosauri]PWU70427.1 pyridine nucleotide-disulfide oxidoreductase [Gracilibacillus dipsosauri]